MPLALVAIAWLLVMTGINGNYTAVGQQFQKDFLGNGQGGGFVQFMLGIVGIAVFFRVIGMPNAGRVFLVLVLVVFMLQNASVLTALENISSASAGPGAGAGGSAPASTPSASTTATPFSLTGAVNKLLNPGAPITPAQAGGNTGEASGTGSST